VSQQTPSTQFPLMHVDPETQEIPLKKAHIPDPLHAPEGQSPSRSRPFETSPQTPSEPVPFMKALHARQIPVQAVSQQTPSTQFPLMHVDPELHTVPSGEGQLPSPVQAKVPEHSSSGSVPAATLPQIPSEP